MKKYVVSKMSHFLDKEYFSCLNFLNEKVKSLHAGIHRVDPIKNVVLELVLLR